MEPAPLSREKVVAHLQKVLGSSAFQGAERSRALLRFVVERTVGDGRDGIKEYTLGAEALGKGEAFDPRADPIVRAEASRLRKRLERYYATEGRDDSVFIMLPKGRYVPEFHDRTTTNEPERLKVAEATARGRGRGIAIGSLASIALVLSAVAWQARRGPAAPSPAPRLVPLTTSPGFELYPTFSPDGGRVAFQWGGERSDNVDIYVKLVGDPGLLRLTTDPARDTVPSWSPDDQKIAFVRYAAGGGGAIHLVSPLGGPERKLTDLVVASGSAWPQLSGPLSWSRDGRWLAVAWPPNLPATDDTPSHVRGVHFVAIPGGETHAATSPGAPAYHTHPAFSPEGSSLAYASCTGWYACHVEIIGLGLDARPRGAPRRLTRKPDVIEGLVWGADAKSVVYAGGRPPRLWRVGVAGDQAPEALEVGGLGVATPAVSTARGRLAFANFHSNADVYRFEAGSPPAAVASSSIPEGNPQLSPDGRRFAFEYGHTAEVNEVWLADADGKDPRRLTHGPGRWQGSPRWAPDGRTIAFDSEAKEGGSDVWTIDVDGGGLRRLTSHPADDNQPSFSRDGRFVYFSSARTGARSVWRVPAAGGPEERLTQTGGGAPFEGFDGKTLFFTRELALPSPLLAVPLGGGPERTVVDCVLPWGFAVGSAGIYHLGCARDGRVVPVYLRDLATGRDRLLGQVEDVRPGFTVSPDGRTILYTKMVGAGSDLMLIENFR